MPTMLTCPAGHQYLAPEGAPAEDQGLCPFCGTRPEIPMLRQERTPPAETRDLRQAKTLTERRTAPTPRQPSDQQRTISLPDKSPDTDDPPTVDLDEKPEPPAPSSAEWKPLTHAAAPPGYELLEELGRGGMAVVYLARRIADDQVVAIKMILSGARASATDRSRFLTEIAALSRLNHPQIVRVLDVGEFQGQLFLCMEYVSGGSLADHLRGVPQVPDFAARLVLSLAEAIDAAHQCGIVHRDLKPGNILVAGPDFENTGTDSGKKVALLKIADFGVARQIDAVHEGSVTAGIVGTPSYMAPEQAAGRRSAATPAADIYSLGAILYECLTGRPPFQGVNVLETWHQVLNEEPVPPRRLNPRIPDALQTICLKCLERNPKSRYEQASDLARDLERFLNNRAIHARPPAFLQQCRNWWGRNRILASILTAFIVLLMLAAGGFWLYSYHLDLSLNRIQAAQNEEHERCKELEASRQLLQQHKADLEAYRYAAQMNQAHRLWTQGEVRSLERILTPYSSSSERHLQDFAYRYLEECIAGSARVLRGHDEDVYSLAWSPDSSTLASVGKDGTLRFWDTLEPTSTPVAAHGKDVNVVAFSQDGRTVATGSDDGRIGLWEARTGGLLAYLPSNDDAIVSLAFSTNGRILYAGTNSGRIHAWSLGTEPRSTPVAKVEGRIHQMVLSHDGRSLAVAGGNSVALVDLVAGNRVHSLRLPRGKPHTVAFSANGRNLALGTNLGSLLLIDLTTSQPRTRERAHLERVESVAFTPDGQLLVSGGGDGHIRLWNPETLELLGNVRGHAGRIWCVAVSPDGHWIASAGSEGLIKLSLPALGRDYESLREDGPAILTLAPLHNAPVVALGTTAGIELLPLDGQERASVPLLADKRGVLSLAVAPDRLHYLYGYPPGMAALGHILPGAHKPLVDTQRDDLPVVFSPDGTLAVTGDAAGLVQCWDVSTGQQTSLSFHIDGPVASLAFVNRHDNLLAVGTGHGHVLLWKLGSKAPQHNWLAHQFEVIRMVSSPNGQHLVTTGRDRTARLWEVATGREVGHGFLGHNNWVVDAAFSPDGRNLATAGLDGTVRVWCVKTDLEMLRLEQPGPARGVAFLDANRLLVVGHDTARLKGYARIYHARPAPAHAAEEPLPSLP